MNQLIEMMLSHLPGIIMVAAIGVAIYQVRRRQVHQENAQDLLAEAVRSTDNEPLSLHPEIDPTLCSGCGVCTTACPEGDILKMINHKAVLVSPTRCVGHGECERACPMSAIKLVFGTKTRGADIPRLTTNYETNIPGLYIAGELGGMGLIRNAVRQGAAAAEHALGQPREAKAQYDLIVIGAGPAGMAAGLAAIAAGKKYLVIEQDKFGGTISNFPRQKIVMSHPFELPIVGKKQFPENEISKERIMAYWNKVRVQTGLMVKESTKFETIEIKENAFVVKTSRGEFTARKVILAMGVRGSARKLGVPGEDLTKVTYNLIEPEQYQQKRVMIVGGGNAAAEAAAMLAESRWRNTVCMIVRTPNLDRTNDTNQKVLAELVRKGRIEIRYNSEVTNIESAQVAVKSDGQIKIIKNDFVFVFAGAEMPRQFLMSLGVKIDKKFGEGLQA